MKDVHKKFEGLPRGKTSASVSSMGLPEGCKAPSLPENRLYSMGKYSPLATASLAFSVSATGLMIAEPHGVQAAEAKTLENSQTHRLFSQGETFMIPAPVTLATAPEAQPVVESSQLVAAASPSSTNRVEPELPAIKHVVEKNETFWSLSQRYGVSAEAIAKLNNLPIDAVLSLGQAIKIPTQLSQPIAVAPKEISLPRTAEVATLEPNKAILSESVDLQVPEDEAIATLRAEQEDLVKSIEQLRDDSTEIVFDAAESPIATESETLISSTAILPVTEEVQAQGDAIVIPVPLPQQPQAKREEEIEASPLLASNAISSEEILPEPPSLQLSNPEFVITPPQEERVAVPLETAEVEAVSEDSSVQKVADKPSNQTFVASASIGKTHTVRSGETLYAIARRYGVAGHELIAANRLDNPNVLKVDQKLVIPRQNAVASTNDFVALLPSTEVTQGVNSNSETLASASTALAQTTAGTEADLAVNFDITAESAVNKLRQDIARMRQDYQVQRASSSPKAAVVEFSLNDDNDRETVTRNAIANPEWNGKQENIANTVATPVAEPISEKIEMPEAPQQLAAASQEDITNYNSLLRLSVGEVVTPELPPLANPDEYLPGEEAFNGYIWPAQGVFTSGYGPRWGRMHRGIDIAAPVGTPIFAAAGGEVISAGWNSGGYGNLVKIKHSDDSVTLYAHNSRIMVRNGQQVKQGQQIAAMGSTGFSTGPHLHFEIHKSGQGAKNPVAFLPKR